MRALFPFAETTEDMPALFPFVETTEDTDGGQDRAAGTRTAPPPCNAPVRRREAGKDARRPLVEG